MKSSRWNIVETREIRKQKTQDGRKFVNNYQLLRTIGQGRFGTVKLCDRITNGASASDNGNDSAAAAVAPGNAHAVDATVPPVPPNRRQFAVKIYSKQMLLKMKEYVSTEPKQTAFSATEIIDSVAAVDTTDGPRMRVVTALDHVRDEIAIMRNLYHRNIVLLFEVIESEKSDKLYLVMEYMAQGPCMVYRSDTKDFVSPLTGGVLTERLAGAHMKDVLHGLSYLHQRGICHRDVKPDNVLLNGMQRCHLTDFGCAKRQEPGSMLLVSDTVGTFQFLAPECCTGEPYDPFQVDVWAAGLLLYIFLFGKLPIVSESAKELLDEIMRLDTLVLLDEASELSASCCDLLRRMLTKDPYERITVADALKHPWFAEQEEEENAQPSF